MPIIAAKLLSLVTATSVTLAAGFGVTIVYFKKDQIFPYWINASAVSESPTQNVDFPSFNEGDDVLEGQSDKKSKKNKKFNTTLDEVNFDFLVGKFTKDAPTTNPAKTLFDTAKKKQQFTCTFTHSSGNKYNNESCKIFKMSSSAGDKTQLDSPTATDANEVKEISELNNNDHYILKISKTFLNLFGYNSQFPLNIQSTEDPTYSFGTFSSFIDINKEQQLIKSTGSQSNLFVAHVTKASTETGAFNHLLEYRCQIASGPLIPCKIYKLETSSAPLKKTDLDAVTKITSASTDLQYGKYIVVELLQGQKTLSQLEGKLEVFKLSEATPTTKTSVVNAVADHLLVGTIGEVTSGNNLFIPKEKYGLLTVGDLGSDTKKTYIVTQTTGLADYLQKTSYSASDYICRVIKDSQKFDDEDCKLFPFLIDGKTHFELSDYKSATQPSNAIGEYSKLALNTYQIIEMKKALKDKLADTGSSLHLVKKDRKDKLINNKAFDLTKKYELSDEDDGFDAAPKTNLFLFRYKSNRPSTAATISSEEQLTCSISAANPDTPINCKIFKFASSTKTNVITGDLIKGLGPITTTQSFVYPVHYVIEFDAAHKKTFADLKNKTITLKKSGTTTLGEFEFDSLIFGLPQVAGLQLPSEEVSYLVEKTKETSNWSDIVGVDSYRCKFPAPSSPPTPPQLDNYDFGCKLIQIPNMSDSKISTFKSLDTLTDKLDLKTKNSFEGNFFKLSFNKKALYNFAFDANSKDASIDLEIFADASNQPTPKVTQPSQTTQSGTTAVTPAKQKTKHVKKLKIRSSLPSTGTPLVQTGNANIVLGEIKTTPTTPSSVDIKSSKCSYTTNGAKFDCQVYSVTADSSKPEEYTPTFTEVTSAADFTTKKQFIIKLDGTKQISELTSSPSNIIYYHYVPAPAAGGAGTPSTPTTTEVTFTINAFLEGTIASGKQLFFIQDPQTETNTTAQAKP